MEHEKDILFEMSRLISSSLAGTITKDEQLKLDAWREESERNRELFDRICSEVVMRDKIKQYNEADTQSAFSSFVSRKERISLKRRWIVRISRYAAILAIPLLIIMLYFNRETLQEEVQQQPEDLAVIKRNVPVLTLSDGQEVVLYNQELLLQEENGVQITMDSKGGIQYNPADSIGMEPVYNTLTTPSQCDFTFTLADGTRVWLNAKSSLRYPVAFNGDERVVYAEGEIYLEVAKDKEHPFFVVLNGMKIEVLGTSFNVNSYADEDYAEVTLVEGHVAARVNDKCYELFPNKQLRWDKEDQMVDIRTVNVNDYIAWKNGQYIFKGRTLGEVAKVLERWYDVDIVFEDESSEDEIYTGVINKEERIDVFVQRLNETSRFVCRVEGTKIFIK